MHAHTDQQTNTHLVHIIITMLKVFASFCEGHCRIAVFLSTDMYFQKSLTFVIPMYLFILLNPLKFNDIMNYYVHYEHLHKENLILIGFVTNPINFTKIADCDAVIMLL